MTTRRVSFRQIRSFEARPRATFNEQGKRKLVIVGAGLAGLSAANYVLKARPDTDLVILEANSTIGGNASSVTVGKHKVSNGVIYFSVEVDAVLQELDIKTKIRELPPPTEGGFVGKRFVTGFYDEKRKKVPGFKRLCDDLKKFAPKMGDPITDSELEPLARQLDQQTAAEFLSRYGDATKAILNPYCRASFGLGLGHISAAPFLSFFAFEEEPKYTVESGGYGLASALANRLNELSPGCIVTQAPVQKIQKREDGLVEVSGETFRIDAEAVMVTTPLVHANRMVKNLSPEKAAIIETMNVPPYLIHVFGPFGEDLMTTYTAWTPHSPFPAVVHTTWGLNDATDYSIRVSDPLDFGARLGKKSVRERQEEVFQGLCKLFPKINEMEKVEVITKVYQHQFPRMGPRFVSEGAPVLREPEGDGQIVLAGQIFPCVESALVEGKRGAQHVLDNIL